MERRLDYLSFLTGGKMTAPFDAFLVFSTNLNPADLGDEAFLRRIQYKMLLRSPAENEFIRIFEAFCTARKLPFSRDLIQRFIEKHYRRTGKPFRRCHPRDVLSHALNLIHFEKLPFALTDEVLDRAFESCFLQEAQAEAAAIAPAAASEPARTESPIMPVMSQTCSDYWGDQVDQINTAFGTLAFIAAFRNRATGSYHDVDSSRQYGETETSRVLEKLHVRAFQSWLSLNFDQQKRDVARYLAAEGGSIPERRLPRPGRPAHSRRRPGGRSPAPVPIPRRHPRRPSAQTRACQNRIPRRLRAHRMNRNHDPGLSGPLPAVVQSEPMDITGAPLRDRSQGFESCPASSARRMHTPGSGRTGSACPAPL